MERERERRMCCAKQRERRRKAERDRVREERAHVRERKVFLSTLQRVAAALALSAAVAWQQQLETCHRMWHDEAQSCQLRRQLFPCSAAQSTHFTHTYICVLISMCMRVCVCLSHSRYCKKNKAQ